eukprot:4222183-Alexandrium_andersonii.AAC.1
MATRMAITCHSGSRPWSETSGPHRRFRGIASHVKLNCRAAHGLILTAASTGAWQEYGAARHPFTSACRSTSFCVSGLSVAITRRG